MKTEHARRLSAWLRHLVLAASSSADAQATRDSPAQGIRRHRGRRRHRSLLSVKATASSSRSRRRKTTPPRSSPKCAAARWRSAERARSASSVGAMPAPCTSRCRRSSSLTASGGSDVRTEGTFSSDTCEIVASGGSDLDDRRGGGTLEVDGVGRLGHALERQRALGAACNRAAAAT